MSKLPLYNLQKMFLFFTSVFLIFFYLYLPDDAHPESPPATESSRMMSLICLLLQLQAPGLKWGSDTADSSASSDGGATFRSIMQGQLLIGDGGVAAGEVVEAVAVAVPVPARDDAAAAAPHTWDRLWPPRACPEGNTR